MSKIVQFCPLCGSDRNKFFERCKFRGRDVVNRICLNCGLVFQSPCMDEDEAAAFYATEYRLLNEGSVDPDCPKYVCAACPGQVAGRFCPTGN